MDDKIKAGFKFTDKFDRKFRYYKLEEITAEGHNISYSPIDLAPE